MKVSDAGPRDCGPRTYKFESRDGVIDIARGELIQLLVVPKNNDGDVDRTEHGKLMRLFEQTAFALEKSPVKSTVNKAIESRIE